MNSMKEQGVTLIEILVALTIFGLLFGVLLTMLTQENQVIRDSLHTLQARLKANETLETLKTIPFQRLTSYSTVVRAESIQLHIDVLVKNADETGTLKHILVTVKWVEPPGRDNTYVLSTLRSKYTQVSTSPLALDQDQKGGTS
ncbi:prepilin-type N-terminal cleavage/methylation domain-containing protein [candidate division KSB3 bacterium]|uniref:Prepilin-type N-terminal cleavage/methylation domain-containing protein n=1 Tax=candidate division KSB3 bacterium TaxID=2044937 RepID=A0A9D5JW71_9BACT|nr:prepilin-type N-terminal cleavage/methylation domain-containing protein [candidate division KSB3 bacterium]MBD3325270.1 prepilin-type N-terminal cleavage/methylation domain-containing protein [candidate division KSB3 bacterium]